MKAEIDNCMVEWRWERGSCQRPCVLAYVFSVEREARSVIYREWVEVGIRRGPGASVEKYKFGRKDRRMEGKYHFTIDSKGLLVPNLYVLLFCNLC